MSPCRTVARSSSAGHVVAIFEVEFVRHAELRRLIVPGAVPPMWTSRSACGNGRSRLSQRLHEQLLALHLGLQPLPDAVEFDGHVVLLYLEHSSQLFDRQPLDVAQQEQACVITVQSGDGAPKLLLQQHTGLDGGVRRPIVVAGLRMKLTRRRSTSTAALTAARAGSRRPAAQASSTLPALGHNAQEDGLAERRSASAGFPVTRRAARNTAS